MKLLNWLKRPKRSTTLSNEKDLPTNQFLQLDELLEKGMYDDAIRLLTRLGDSIAETSGKDSLDYSGNLSLLGTLYFKTGDKAKAQSFYREAIDLQRRLFGNGDVHVAKSLARYGIQCSDRLLIDEAEVSLKEALPTLRRILGDKDPLVQRAALALAVVYFAQGREDEFKILQAWSGVQMGERKWWSVGADGTKEISEDELPPDVSQW
jgi:tetratricopeptide (TPR) repeat protein